MGYSENYNIIILFYNIIQCSDPFFFQNETGIKLLDPQYKVRVTQQADHPEAVSRASKWCSSIPH